MNKYLFQIILRMEAVNQVFSNQDLIKEIADHLNYEECKEFSKVNKSTKKIINLTYIKNRIIKNYLSMLNRKILNKEISLIN
jgi:AraC-like DNA-binding protein